MALTALAAAERDERGMDGDKELANSGYLLVVEGPYMMYGHPVCEHMHDLQSMHTGSGITQGLPLKNVCGSIPHKGKGINEFYIFLTTKSNPLVNITIIREF